jgi:hypothetical protein
MNYPMDNSSEKYTSHSLNVKSFSLTQINISTDEIIPSPMGREYYYFFFSK